MLPSLLALLVMQPAWPGEGPDVVDVNTHFSTVVELPQKANITIVDPRVAGVRAMIGPHFQLYGVGKGETALHLQYVDGTGHTMMARVKDKKPKGKPVAHISQGHSEVITLDADASYAESGDKSIAFVTLLHKRFVHVVGVKKGSTDVVVQAAKTGLSSIQVVHVTDKPADLEARPLVELAVGAEHRVELPARPRAFSVANAGVAAACLDLSGTPTIVLTGRAIGSTDLIVTDTEPHYWSIRVR